MKESDFVTAHTTRQPGGTISRMVDPEPEPGAPEPLGPEDPTPIEPIPIVVHEEPGRCRCFTWARVEPVDLTEEAYREHHSRCVMHPLFDPARVDMLDEQDVAVIDHRIARLRDIEHEGQRCRACREHLVWSDVGAYWRCATRMCPHYCRPPG